MWPADGSSLVPRARIVECDRAKPFLSSKTDLKTPQSEANGHVRPGLLGHFIVEDDYEDDYEDDSRPPGSELTR